MKHYQVSIFYDEINHRYAASATAYGISATGSSRKSALERLETFMNESFYRDDVTGQSHTPLIQEKLDFGENSS